MKKTKHILSVFLSLCMIISCMVGISVTASAESLFTFTSTDVTCSLQNLSTEIDNKKSSVVKVEAIIESEGAEFAQIQWGYWDGEWHASAGGITSAAGVHKVQYAGEALPQTYAVEVQHQGNGKLHWVKVYYSDATSTELGKWVDVTGVQVTPATATLNVDETVALTATVTGESATVKKVAWSAENGNVQLYTDEQCTTEVGTALTDVLTVYAKGITGGIDTVTVSSNELSNKSASCAITVNAASAATPTVTISPEGAGIVTPEYEDYGGGVWILTPTPATGYSFVKWTYNNNGTPGESNLPQLYINVADVNDTDNITAVFESSAHSITMSNGGTAKVDGTVVTSAAEGATVTIVADEPVSGTEFNGWTSSTEGVTFADASAATTTFTMPAADVEITASYQETAPTPAPTPTPTPYVPFYTATTTTPTAADEPAETMTFESEETISHTNLLSWSGVSGASSYLISVKTDGKFVPLATTTKTNIDVIHAYNGKYYVSEDGKYTAYTYKDGKFVKGGTITAAQAEKLVKANNVTDTYMLQYTKNAKLSSDKTALTVSLKIYYKPAVKATSKDGKVVLKWNKVEGAEKYRVYKYTNGKLTKIADTDANAVRINKVTAGKTYKYAVKAYVDGKWTKVYASDLASITVK